MTTVYDSKELITRKTTATRFYGYHLRDQLVSEAFRLMPVYFKVKDGNLWLDTQPVKNNDWTWDLDLNFTKNETYLLELTEGVDFVEFWDEARVKNIAYVKNDE